MKKNEPLNLIVSRNIRKRREDLGLSQETLAELCGLHRTYIGALERGERNMTVNTLEKVSKSLDCTAVELLTDANTEVSC